MFSLAVSVMPILNQGVGSSLKLIFVQGEGTVKDIFPGLFLSKFVLVVHKSNQYCMLTLHLDTLLEVFI